MRHTIVVELPDGVDSSEVEKLLTSRVENVTLVVGRDEDGMEDYGWPKVAEYHHERLESEGWEVTDWGAA